MQVKVNGTSVHYRIAGKGKNLVLIHGAGDNLEMWYNQVEAFSRSYRVITYDVRGSGKTDISEGKYTVSLLVQDVYEFLNSIDVKEACILGYSMGGRIATQTAIEYPDLVKALILVGSSPDLTPLRPEAMQRSRAMLALLNRGDIKTFARMMTSEAFSPGFESSHNAEFMKYMNVKLKNKPDGIARIMRLAPPESTPDLGRIKCPVLLIAGENDWVMGPEQAKQAQKAINNTKLVVLPSGHASPIESPEKFNMAVLEFLDELQLR
jgi:3-oxoadipate enol-lactonase